MDEHWMRVATLPLNIAEKLVEGHNRDLLRA